MVSAIDFLFSPIYVVDIGDDEITDVSFPKGIPFVYKFDKNLETIKPEDNELTQIHTNGSFLEKPGLLRKAQQTQKLWEEHVPGSSGNDIPNVAKRVSTVEAALLKLKEEQKRMKDAYEESIETQDSNKGSILTNGDNKSSMNGDDADDGRFEENLDTSMADEGITVKWSSATNPNDPIVVFVRHGRTPHNKLKLFTGWEDPALAVEGVEDARAAGRLLKKHGFEFDVVYSSWLYRAIQTAWYILEEMDMLWLPMIKSWRLNERH